MVSTTHKNHTTEQNQQSMENSIGDRLDSSSKSSQSWGRSRARPGYQDGTPALVEPLTEEQYRSLQCIGNQRAANRMVRPRRFTYTREEKLFAIRYCREARSLNVETSRWYPINVEVAARKLLVEERTLKRWMREEDQIVAMPPGSKRADKRPRVRAKTLAAPQQGTRETVSGYEGSFEDESSLVNHKFSYYLHLSPRQLRDMLSLTASDHRLHTLQHPVPFVGIEGGRVGKLYTFQDAYNFLDCPNIHSHPGHPLPPSTVSGSPSNERPSLNIHAESTYTSRAGESNIPNLRVVDVNKQLYELAPEFGVRAPTGGYTGSYASVRPCYDELKYCVALICQSIATSSSKVTSALPVRIELDYDCPYPGAPAQWAVLLSFGDEEVLLPLALSLWGSQTMNASRPNILYLQGWTIDHGIRISPREFKVKEYYKNIQRLFEVFRHSTVLHVMDVEPLFLRAEDRWRPRRYTSTWTLYTTPIHANYVCSGFYSPIQGRFMDIEILVNNIHRWGSRVIFTKDTTRNPFQLLRLRDFTLHRPASQPYDHLYSLTEKLVEGVRPQGSKAPFSDEVDAFTTSKVVKDGEGISISPYTMLQSREPDRGTDGARDVTDSIAEPEDFADTTDADEVGEATPSSNRGHTKKKRLYQRSSMQRAVLKNYSLVDGKKKCLILTCPLPQELYSGYCKHHSSRIIQYVSSLKAMGAELPMPQWELKLTDDAMTDVKALSTSYHRSPQNTWVIDFEYISLSGDMSPIPLQFAIRQLDGKLLLAENVHYGLSLEDFLVKINTWENEDRHVQVLFTHCYGDIVTNGLRPDEIRDEINHNLNYSAERISIISWFSPQDMQCFQRLLSGSPELIVPKKSHHLCSNFQNIDVGRLLKKLLPMNWSSLSLPVVHSSLLASQGRSGDKGEYHTAAYDTEAVTDIVKEITTLI
ncbi:hypothetical protein BDV39DRAFT_192208 [Aspergillus sergii]|uniref:Uncharacterized protein n=1 Tax=Aspergillus sergii TaxID=1034303 RepID=A0A5N6X7N3_9EURO|nr:hypothetical protein BDV39DRAFT_192208 [Aspergillus sergii]